MNSAVIQTKRKYLTYINLISMSHPASIRTSQRRVYHDNTAWSAPPSLNTMFSHIVSLIQNSTNGRSSKTFTTLDNTCLLYALALLFVTSPLFERPVFIQNEIQGHTDQKI